jgi:D-beta-D-heptose 7-phosphate kinase/D-beta-D-heptose 1-phosphate adenosyltransferase
MTPATLPDLSPARAHDLIGRLAGRRLLVVGDVMLDRFVIGDVARISPEAPVPVVVHERDECRLGGAANAAHNARTLGASVALVGVIGDDDEAARLTRELASRQLSASALVTVPGRRTTAKVRVVTKRHQQVARIDYETDDDLDAATEDRLMDAVDQHIAGVEILLVSDYQKGVISRRVVAQLVARAHEQSLPILVDPKVPHLEYYRGATLVTPNLAEAERAAGRRIRSMSDVRNAARAIQRSAGVEGVLITLGERGLWLSCGEIEGSLAATAREVADVTGAGDTAIATLAIALAAGAAPAEAAHLANEAAGIVVGRFGPATVTADELRARFA